MIMTFKVRANLTFSKDLTIEADTLSDAMEQARQQMQGKIPASELTFKDVNFHLVSHAIGDHGLEEIDEKT